MAYNYRNFPLDLDAASFAAFDTWPTRAGTKAPSGPVYALATGRSVELSSLWKEQPLVIEFGSLT